MAQSGRVHASDDIEFPSTFASAWRAPGPAAAAGPPAAFARGHTTPFLPMLILVITAVATGLQLLEDTAVGGLPAFQLSSSYLRSIRQHLAGGVDEFERSSASVMRSKLRAHAQDVNCSDPAVAADEDHTALCLVLVQLMSVSQDTLLQENWLEMQIQHAGLFHDDRPSPAHENRSIYGSDAVFMHNTHGTGLWQTPMQLGPAMRLLATRQVRHYLEVGSGSGWTGTLITAYLSRFALESAELFDCHPLLDAGVRVLWDVFGHFGMGAKAAEASAASGRGGAVGDCRSDGDHDQGLGVSNSATTCGLEEATEDGDGDSGWTGIEYTLFDKEDQTVPYGSMKRWRSSPSASLSSTSAQLPENHHVGAAGAQTPATAAAASDGRDSLLSSVYAAGTSAVRTIDVAEPDSTAVDPTSSARQHRPRYAYDLVFIDGDQGWAHITADFEHYSPLSRILMLHDINDHTAMDVSSFWSHLKEGWHELLQQRGTMPDAGSTVTDAAAAGGDGAGPTSSSAAAAAPGPPSLIFHEFTSHPDGYDFMGIGIIEKV